MDDNPKGGAGTGGGDGDAAGGTPPSATSIWEKAPQWKDSPTFDVASNEGKGPIPPTSDVYLGMDAATIFGLDFTHTSGIVCDTTVGSEYFVQVNPMVLANLFSPALGAAFPSELTCNVGTNVEILFGQQVAIHFGPEEIEFNFGRKRAVPILFASLVCALAASYPILCYLIADNEIWEQKKEGDLVAYYQTALQLSLSIFVACYVKAAHAEEVATAKEFELLMNDHMGTA
jgi:hypothetical protein